MTLASGDKVMVTGGAGFIGSHLVDSLLGHGLKVSVVDNLSTGSFSRLTHNEGVPGFRFFKRNLTETNLLPLLNGCEEIFHLAANPEVRNDIENPMLEFEQDIASTRAVLEAARKSENCDRIVFSSSSTVYGESNVIPTPETFGPLRPISIYGSTKLSCEALISSYCHLYGLKGVILRLANVVGPRARHGVLPDFISKLARNPRELVILGDGTQQKSYLHVSDALRAFLIAGKRARTPITVLNVGSKDAVDVLSVARSVAEAIHAPNVQFKLSGGVDGGRGWRGDVKRMLLDISAIERLGWQPVMPSIEALRTAAKELITDTVEIKQSVI